MSGNGLVVGVGKPPLIGGSSGIFTSLGPPGPPGGGPPKLGGGPGGRSTSFCEKAAGARTKAHRLAVSRVRVLGFMTIF